jgi:hypothetical protein
MRYLLSQICVPPPGAAANADRQPPAPVEHIVINVVKAIAAAISGGTDEINVGASAPSGYRAGAGAAIAAGAHMIDSRRASARRLPQSFTLTGGRPGRAI